MLVVMTDLSSIKLRKHQYHFYTGNDATMFRYADHALLKIGYYFSERALEIIKLISEGMDSRQIAGELFVSVNTINTHRRNILKKIDKSTTHELIIELQGKGYL